ncbi:MAG: GYD domain-containing protein [Candidatus Omnitrophica bacterium]|nr:GYD domain-containing protein [Candidatus Omnitrophota bacterium]
MMTHYVILANFTAKGFRAVKDTGNRAQVFRSMAQKMGVTVKNIFWTLGRYDVVLILEAPSDEKVAGLMMKLGTLGNLTTQTLRAFTEEQIESLISKL